MLKLKDIFNIDLNSKGGGKLYKKIMRKYNIPLKDTKEVKQEIVECSSSSGDGGVKEYYYKTSDPETIAAYLATGGLISGVVQYKNTETNKGDTIEYLYTESFIESIIAFKIPNIETRFWGSYEGSAVSNFIILNGDFYNRLSAFFGFVGDTISPEQIKEEYKDMIQEITKEEYESMITYKP